MPGVLALAVLVLAIGGTAYAEEDEQLTRERLEATIEQLETNAALSEAQKKEVRDTTRKAISYIESLDVFRETRERYIATAAEAPAQLTQLKASLAAAASLAAEATPPLPDANLDLAQVDQLLLEARTAAASLQTTLAAAEERLEAAASSLPEARKRLPVAERELLALADAPVRDPASEDAPELVLANRRLAEAHTAALNAEIAALNQAVATYPIRVELRETQRDLLRLQLEAQKARIRSLEDVINKQRVSDAEAVEAAAEATRQDTAGKHPVLQDFASRNARLGATLTEIAEARQRLTDGVDNTAQQVKQLEEDFENTQRKLAIAGLSEVVGRTLRDRRRTLPDVRAYEAAAEARETEIAEIGLQQIRLREERQGLKSLPEAIAGVLAELPNQPPPEVVTQLRGLLEARVALIDKTVVSLEDYARALAELDFESRRLIDISERYDAFLDERLLWVRSSSPLSLEILQSLPQEVGLLLSPANWREVATAWYRGMLASPFWFLGIALFVYLLWRRGRAIRTLAATSRLLGKPTTDRLVFTWQALLLTLAAALPWTVLLATFGWPTRHSPISSDFSQAVGHGLTWVSYQLFLLESLRTFCHPRGLGAAHFRWPTKSLSVLRRTIVQVTPVLIPATFVTVFFIYSHDVRFAGTLSFVVVALTLAWFFHRVLNPNGQVLDPYMSRHTKSLVVKTRLLWFPLAVLMPLVLAGYAIMGFLYTSALLTGRLVQSVWFIMAVIVVHAIAGRWLLITRRKLAFEAALERRAAALKAAEDGDKAEGGGLIEDLRSEIEVPQIDLTVLDVQTRKLLSLGVVLALVGGLWWIWSAVIPAFGILDNVQLWRHKVDLGGEEALAPITMGDFLLAIVIGVVTTILAKSLPTFVEVVLLQRFEVSSGSRYAITTLSGYAIAAGGFLWAFNTIGADWSQLQWLVAALGVGIGFGLQEIVANFISGLIILFERPIRVGDVVTVGETDGVVARIQIRATTIRNWDKKELLVPNKEFITGRLLNWSLSDQMNRILIYVGIAYGSDVDQALQLLEEAACEHANVLADPPPQVVFEGFGDSALNLSLRCYLSSLDYRLITMSDINRAINRKFAAADIGIPFPQRDVHLDTLKPLDVRVHPVQPTNKQG